MGWAGLWWHLNCLADLARLLKAESKGFLVEREDLELVRWVSSIVHDVMRRGEDVVVKGD